LWKLRDGSGYFILHKRTKKKANVLVMTQTGLSNQASCKLIFFGKEMRKTLRSWDLKLPENVNLYLSEDSGQLFFYPNADSNLKDIHIFEMNEKYDLKKLGVLKMNLSRKITNTPEVKRTNNVIKKRPQSRNHNQRKKSKLKNNNVKFLFHRENIFLLDCVKYELLVYSSKMVFKYRINISGVSPINTLLEIYPLGCQTLLIHEF